MIIPGDIASLIDFFGFTISMFYCAAMVALIVMRFTKKDEHRPIKVHTFCCLRSLWLQIDFKSITGTHHHPNNCYGGFRCSSRRTHRCGPANSILLCASFYSRRTYFLRAFCLLRENGTGNRYDVLIILVYFYLIIFTLLRHMQAHLRYLYKNFWK